MRCASCFAVAAILLPCAAALADEPAAPLEPGARVRLTLPCEPGRLPATGGPADACREEGRLVSMEGDTVTLAVAESTRSYPLAAASRIEVSRGSRSAWRIGAGAGFVVGAVGTFALLNQGESTNPCDSSANQDAIGMGGCVGLAAVGGVAGAGLGALIGKLFRSEDWQRVRVDRVQVSLGPQAGARFRVAVAF